MRFTIDGCTAGIERLNDHGLASGSPLAVHRLTRIFGFRIFLKEREYNETTFIFETPAEFFRAGIKVH